MRRLFSLFIIPLFALSSYATDPTGPVPSKFIVKLSTKANVASLSQSLGKENELRKLTNLRLDPALQGSHRWERVYVVHSKSQTLSESDIVTLLGAENIEYIEPDYYLEFFDFPTDHLFARQWHLYNVGQEYYSVERVPGYFNDVLRLISGLPGHDVGLEDFYNSTPPERTRVVVAIVDSGIDLVHPEMEGRIWQNPDEIPGNGVDDDHNGLIDDTAGYDVSGDVIDFFNPQGDNDPTDDHGHGTHIAGIVGANANGEGVVGIAPWVELMPVKIRPNATSSVGAAGLLYAVNAGAQVINVSWGTPFESTFLREAVDFARRNNVLICIAPGNTGDNTRYFPAGFDSTFVVAAGNSHGNMTSFSTFGAHIDIVAPGQDILSLRAAGTDMYAPYPSYEPDVRIIDSLYYISDGTSMATPMVVGAAALMLSLRPDLTRAEVEELLLQGATDLVDPLQTGDSLVGPDTISGYGYLNIDASLALLQQGSVYISEPVHRNRYIADIPIKIAATAGYSGGWTLEFSMGFDPDTWQFLASGDLVPGDSLIYTFSNDTSEGFVNFRIIDDFGSQSIVTVTHSRQNRLEITGPADNAELEYNIPIFGNAYGPNYDSLRIFYRDQFGSVRNLTSATGEYFDSLLYDWSVSGSDTGSFTIFLLGHFGTDIIFDSVQVHVNSAFAAGWPRSIGGRGGMTAICSDINKDDVKEVIVATAQGLMMFRGDNGAIVPGFPVSAATDMRCVPAVYDVDDDGWDEIIATNVDGIHIFDYDGYSVQDQLIDCYTGQIAYEYAFPNPTVAELRYSAEPGATPTTGIMILNKIGQLLAYRLNGDPYFFGLGGLFANFSERVSFAYGMGGGSSPFVTSANLTGNGYYEVVASFTSPAPHVGLGLFNGANGQPALGADKPSIEEIPYVHGTVLADLTGDDLPEVITLGNSLDSHVKMWVKTQGDEDLDGWPITLPDDIAAWIASYPIAADLDLDGVPEILCTFFEYDVAALYIYKADGSPYVIREGRPPGEAFAAPATFGTPGVANLTGDAYPEIIFRSGFLLPNTGPEQIYILDHQAQPLPGWPKSTPARPYQVFSSRFAPLVDDLDNDGLVELAMISDGIELLVWDFDASVEDGKNTFRFLADNRNSGIMQPGPGIRTDVGNEDPLLLPLTATLRQNYPNPFNPRTTISFTIPARQRVSLRVFNILGREVATLVDGELTPGTYDVEFDGTPYATGIYLYRLETKETVLTKKMIMVK